MLCGLALRLKPRDRPTPPSTETTEDHDMQVRSFSSGLPLPLMMLVAAVGVSPAWAQTSGVRIELNRLEAAGENCRAYFLIDNQKGAQNKSCAQ